MSEIKLVNIAKDNQDKFYRYKREQSLIEYKNKNSVIHNLYNISKQLCGNLKIKNKTEISNQIFQALIKKIKSQLSVSLQKIQDNNSYKIVIKGIIKENDIEEIINNFVIKHILCPSCKIPEWNGKDCSACGYSKNKIQVENKLEIENEIEKESENLESEVKISNYIKALYDKRDLLKNNQKENVRENIKQIDDLIDSLFKINNEKELNKLIEKSEILKNINF